MPNVGLFKTPTTPAECVSDYPVLIDRREVTTVPRVGETINVDHGEAYKVIRVSHDWIDDHVQLLVEEM